MERVGDDMRVAVEQAEAIDDQMFGRGRALDEGDIGRIGIDEPRELGQNALFID